MFDSSGGFCYRKSRKISGGKKFSIYWQSQSNILIYQLIDCFISGIKRLCWQTCRDGCVCCATMLGASCKGIDFLCATVPGLLSDSGSMEYSCCLSAAERKVFRAVFLRHIAHQFLICPVQLSRRDQGHCAGLSRRLSLPLHPQVCIHRHHCCMTALIAGDIGSRHMW